MQLVRIKLKNFKKHKDLELNIRPGIIGVMGSNGSGKSSFLEGIYFGLTGKSLNGESRSELRTWGESADGYVEISFIHGKKAYTITRMVNKNNAILTCENDDSKIIGITEVADFLNNNIGLDYDALKQVLFVAQEQLDTPLKGTESARKDAFGKLFGCNDIEKLRDIVQSFSSDVPVNKLLTNSTLDLLKAEIDSDRSKVVTYTDKLQALEREEATYPGIMQIAKDIVKPSKEAAETAIQQLTTLLKEYTDKAEEAISKTSNTNIEELYSKKAEAESKLEMLNRGVCPTCHTVLQSFEFTKDEVLKELSGINDNIHTYQEVNHFLSQASKTQDDIDRYEQMLASAISASEIAEKQKQYNQLLTIQNEKTKYQSLLNGHLFVIEEKENRLRELEGQIEDNNKKLSFIQTLNDIRAAFHRDAVQKDLRTFGAEAINNCLTECLSVFNVPYSVYFTTDGLAKFTDKDKQEHDFLSLSGGQKKIVSLAYRLSLMRLFANNINICVLDEPTSFIDTANIEAMKNAFVSLSEFAQQHNMTIFIATHEYSLVPIFDALLEL